MRVNSEIFIDSLPVVLVDMDGVLANFDSEIIARLKSRHPNIPILNNRINHYISSDYEEHEELVKSLCDEPGLFESLPLIDHALEGWQRIIDLGYHPRICSTPLGTNPNSKAEKYIWLRQNFVPVFGEWVVDQAIITQDKHLYDGIALIDDRPEIEENESAIWKHIIYDQPYNKDVKKPRLKGWLDAALPDLLKEAQE